ncbi:hypothetical protein CRE_21365 [Caenorhabditis remanei]|nr:hypothetical protein CRE_21365 [Caenorhabditis remanei]
MAYDMNSLFSSNQPPLNGGGGGPGGPPQQQQGPQSLWSLQQFSQMGG